MLTKLETTLMEVMKHTCIAISHHLERKRDPEIVWEQRRYEIAKDLYVHHDIDEKRAIQWADRLIDELKKKSK